MPNTSLEKILHFIDIMKRIEKLPDCFHQFSDNFYTPQHLTKLYANWTLLQNLNDTRVKKLVIK